MDVIILLLTMLSGFFVVYHHVFYPVILKKFSKKKIGSEQKDIDGYKAITILVPAYNEENFIRDKIINLAMLDYPNDCYNVLVYCDGCTDETAKVARLALQHPLCEGMKIEIVEAKDNIGKTALLNKVIPTLDSEIIALSDVSALLSVDALQLANKHFHDPNIGVVAGTYHILNPGNNGEAAYWSYQTEIKKGESALGGPIGAHGAFYLIRKELFQLLSDDCVNDDFVIPMQIIEKGYQAVYETKIMALELESANDEMDYKRRCRIAKGNVQQVFQLKNILKPRYKGTAFSFFSGKVLRAVMPILLLICLIGSIILSFSSVMAIKAIFSAGVIAQISIYCVAYLKEKNIIRSQSKIIHLIHYIVYGHIAGFIGIYQYMKGENMKKKQEKEKLFTPMTVRFLKRTIDILGALIGMIIGAIIFPFVALLIRLDSKGPVIFKQMRIGQSDKNKTNLFWLYKFRTMNVDAEAATGAVWASKNDPRVTRIGMFLRKTRLDEIPQLWNVLKGDMSLVGPRPERPGITGDLNKEIPFFAERTYNVKPGITGLAQVYNGYDQSIEDARNKAAYDHSYALSLSGLRSWLCMDLLIIKQTIMVVLGARGQ